MGLLMLSAGCGSLIKIFANGNERKEALNAIIDLINRKFDEE
jgi:phosphocarrier protein